MDNCARTGFRVLFTSMLLALTAACGGGGGGGNDEPTVKSIAVTPALPSLPKGSTLSFRATAVLTDNSTKDVTTQVTWSSSNTAVATINAAGLATAVAASTSPALIKAALGTLVASTPLTVTEAQITRVEIEPASPSVAKGLSKQLKATAVFTDSTTQDVTETATWQSADSGIATIDADGLLAGVAVGSTPISASFGTKTGTATATVTAAALTTIQVEPGSASLPAGGFTLQFKAIGLFSDNSSSDITSQVVWSSSDSAKATIGNADDTKGLATSTDTTGTSNIVASLGTVNSSAATLTVTAATLSSIQVEPASLTLALGRSRQFSATAMFSDDSTSDVTKLVTWASSNLAVATISNANGSRGLSVSQGVGTSDITAVLKEVTSAAATVTVTNAQLVSLVVSPATEILPKGFNRQYQATGTFSDGSVSDVSDSVTWVSSNSNVATISNAADTRGIARGGAAGSTTITAVSGSVDGSTSLTVTDALLESLTVAPATASIPLGTTQAFTATGEFDDGFEMDVTTQVTWMSADNNVVTVSNAADTAGVATSRAQGGPIAITATRSGTTITGAAELSVSSAAVVALTVQRDSSPCLAPTEPSDTDTSLPLGFSAGFLACAEYTNGQIRDVTGQALWSTQAAAVATVSNEAASKGIASPVAEGRTVVVATLSGKSDSSPVQVTSASLTALAVTPAGQTMLNGGPSIQYVATGTFSDGALLRVTRHTTWSASSDSVSMSNAPGSQGLASPGRNVLLSETVTISAVRDAITGTTTLTRAP